MMRLHPTSVAQATGRRSLGKPPRIPSSFHRHGTGGEGAACWSRVAVESASPRHRVGGGSSEAVIRRILIAAVCLAALVAGCGSPNYVPPAATQPADAQAALVAALDAWKEGVTLEELREQPQPMYVGDEDWQAGVQLAGYRIGSPEVAGLHVIYPVDVELQRNSRRQKKTVRYHVTTEPVIHIMRGDE